MNTLDEGKTHRFELVSAEKAEIPPFLLFQELLSESTLTRDVHYCSEILGHAQSCSQKIVDLRGFDVLTCVGFEQLFFYDS